jgi:hypothetical protein
MLLDLKTVLDAVTRIVGGGAIDALPRRRSHQLVLLALAAARFDAGRAYREDEVNQRLMAWLEPFTTGALDHVSVRRELVDRQFLLRDAAGNAYRLNTAKLDASIKPAARSIDPGAVLVAVQLQRDVRKRARGVTE